MIFRTKKFSIYEVDNTSEVIILSKVNDSTHIIFDNIYNGITCEDASSVSLQSRKKNKEKYKNLISYTLTYGEINSIQPIRNIFQLLKQLSLLPTNGKFYDLGSGTGRPVIAASLLHPFDCCIGIELLDGLHSLSLQALEQWKTNPDISLILMDVMMPEMDGYDAMSEIRRLENGKQVPIISITARTQADERQKKGGKSNRDKSRFYKSGDY